MCEIKIKKMSFIMFFVVVGVLISVLLGLNLLFAVNRPDHQKYTMYESGFEPVSGQTRSQITINYL